MRVVSVINLKGGVAKTTTAQNLAYGLQHFGGKRVLVIDNDKQGNISKSFNAYSPDSEQTTANLMIMDSVSRDVIHATAYENIDIIPANMQLLTANMQVMLDVSRQQQDRMEEAFEVLKLEEHYDFVVIDNAPDINISIINALRVTDDVIIPVQMDEYSFDGISVLLGQLRRVQHDLRRIGHKEPSLSGILCTCYQKDDISREAAESLNKSGLPIFNTRIRFTKSKPKEAISEKMPLLEYSIRCGAAQDYKHFVLEYMDKLA